MTSLLRRVAAIVGWLTLIMAVAGLTWAAGVEGWSDRWRATDDEVAASLPGDDMIEDPAMVTTRAVTVAAPDRPSAPEEAPWTWTFVVRPDGDGGTRLIVRNRNATVGAFGDVVWDRIVGPIGFAMERRTILGVAQRAEAGGGADVAPDWREPLWFAALLVTGLAVLAIIATRAPPGRRVTYVVAFTAAATLVLFRFPSPWWSVALAATGTFVAVVLWRAWPPGGRVDTSATYGRNGSLNGVANRSSTAL